VEYAGDQDSDGLRDSDRMTQRESQELPPGIGRSIRLDVPCRETMLVAVMSDGSYPLVVYPPDEPAALAVEEKALLKQALAGEFGKHRDDQAASGNDSGTPERGTLGAKQVQL
jgi:hypothetical protein